MSDQARMPASYDDDNSREPESLIDPDCRDGKHGSCVGEPCECECHYDKE
jgi:hypothetical protein